MIATLPKGNAEAAGRKAAGHRRISHAGQDEASGYTAFACESPAARVVTSVNANQSPQTCFASYKNRKAPGHSRPRAFSSLGNGCRNEFPTAND